jgi:uncharacterized protein YijF (DUF1287 family)
MTELQIKEHEAMKKKFSNYPKLPKFILRRNEKNYEKPNKGLQHSCVMGFYSRVENWYKANTPEYKS